ncbi:MAG TPA: DUF3667 domain-containing protein [Aliidongia sp.]|nr:DUF3667 domain-containing protein [Aliidongia sp.]
MPAPTSPAPFHCRNCGHPRADRFCARCGQDSRDHSRELGELFRDFAEHVLAFDLKSIRTLGTLLTKPGQLTLDWAQGRRMTWVSPLRLYLGASFLFYVALWASGLALLQISATPMTDAEIQAAGIKPHDDGTPIYFFSPEMFVKPVPQVTVPPQTSERLRVLADSTGIPKLAPLAEAVLANPARLNEAADVWLPRILFALVPLAAALFALFRGHKPLLYMDHLAFALHLQSFIFLLAIAMMPLWARYDTMTVSVGPGLVILAYGALAHRRTYGNALWLSAIKVLIVLSIYLTTLLFGLIAVAGYELWRTLG